MEEHTELPALHQVLSLCYALGAFDLPEIVHLSLSSKECKQWCLSWIRVSPEQQLVAATAAAARHYASTVDEREVHAHGRGSWLEHPGARRQQHALQWLVSTAPIRSVTAATAAALVSIPMVPPSCVELLVSAGVEVSYQQLLAAARARIRGIETWIEVQSRLPCTQDMSHHVPAAVEAICCHAEGHSLDLTKYLAVSQADIQDVFRIAVNCSRTATVCAVGQALWFQALRMNLDQDYILELLLTAVIRQHIAGLSMFVFTPMAHAVSSEAVCQLVLTALQHSSTNTAHDASAVLFCLKQFPAFKQLSTEAMKQCLWAAVQRWDSHSIDIISSHCDAAQQLSPEVPPVLLQLLRWCAQSCKRARTPWVAQTTAGLLCQWPSAAHLPAAGLVDVLDVAMQHQSMSVIVRALWKPQACVAAERISAESRMDLLLKAVQMRSCGGSQQAPIDNVLYLKQLPATPATMVKPAQMVQVLTTAVKAHACSAVYVLAREAVSGRIGSGAVAELLQTALGVECSHCVCSMLDLEAVLGQQLSAQSAMAVQQAAARSSIHPRVHARLQARLASRKQREATLEGLEIGAKMCQGF